MSGVSMVARQFRFTNKAFWRNPASAFFTFAFPLMFLVIFTTLLGNGDAVINGVEVKTSTLYVASMAAFSVITACYTNIAISVSFSRDQGILKRTRGTPLPAWAYLAGRVVHATVIATILVAICAVFGRLVYDASLPAGLSLFKFLIVLIVGSASFSALALALTAFIPNADASPAIVNASILPLLFLSGVFIPIDDRAPAWIDLVGKVFPVRHFLESMNAGFLGTPFEWIDVLFVALWGIAGLLIAARFFSWEPRK
ncbi:MAG: ABC transporter permease [Actinomycetota bacterium]|nr:ABC transporter permease [Actinomycetota bacterium]